jgi:hypothetical protein
MQRYEALHYPRDLTEHENLQPGRILGHDEIGRPYEVIDAELEIVWPQGQDAPSRARTTVNLQYAGTEALKAEMVRRGEANA